MVDNFYYIFAGRLAFVEFFLKLFLLLLFEYGILLLNQFFLKLVELFQLHFDLRPNLYLLGVLPLLRKSCFHEVQVLSRTR